MIATILHIVECFSDKISVHLTALFERLIFDKNDLKWLNNIQRKNRRVGERLCKRK